VRQAGGKVEEVHIATDHSYSGKRVALAAAILNWLSALPGRPSPRAVRRAISLRSAASRR
jgi:hypothetical protein